MTPDMLIVLTILFVAIVFFVTEWLRVDVVALSVVVLLMLTGVLTTGEALSGFSDTAVMTIAALFIVGGGVLHTGLAGMLGRRILEVAGTNETRLVVVLMIAVAALSGFMSNTGTVAVLLPAVIILARSVNIPPSRLLIPMAFASSLGGAITLIGTPPNIIVSDALRSAGHQPFGFFTYAPMGIILVIIGVLYMLFFGRRLLPDRRIKIESERIKTPEELIDIYRLPDNLFRLRVRRGSPLIGQTIADAGFGKSHNISILDILRREEPRPRLRLVSGGDAPKPKPRRTSIIPDANTVIELDDILIVQGEGDDISITAADWNLGVRPATEADEAEALLNDEVGVAEVLIPPRSNLIGKTVVESRFGSRHKLTVLGITGPSANEKLDVKTTKLRFGDILLVQGPWRNILDLKDRRQDFIIIGQPESMIAAPDRQKALLALSILVGMVLLMISGVASVVIASMIAGLAMVFTRCLTMDEAYQVIDWKSLVLVAGMLPMSIALDKVGLISLVAQWMVDVLGVYGPLAIMAGLFLLTSLFTQVISNTATTVLVAPIALTAAETLGLRPFAFMMVVAIAASMAFATPVASPSNTLVMGAGDYRFSDYIKVGVPLIGLTLIVSLLLLPLLFPFS